MKFTILIAVLLLPWAVVESRAGNNFVSTGMVNLLILLLPATR
jgi:hypothetical protein